ncbi:MAG: protein kinase [Candidatus Solibacter usitatus]|nr:protein kinase [Candidatus Solibacter usitatus]
MVGERLLHYQIREKLGEGGMGVVYKAFDTQLDRSVAIKILPPEKAARPDRKQRFIQEAKAASALNHPNIVTIHQIGCEDGCDFIVMEFVEGETLDRLIARGPLRLKEVLHYGVQIAAGLERAHAAAIVHRDLKPANLMVTTQGLVKILDFGLAKLNEALTAGSGEATVSQAAPLTEAGMVMGTYAYMSPEQAQARQVDGRSDIFSLGAVLYELIAGRRAFQGPSNLAILTAVLRDDPPPVAEAGSELQEIVARCLRKEPAQRFPQMLDVRLALEDLRSLQSTSVAASRRIPAVEIAPSIAVLPFTNLSPDKENEYFSDGLAEEIINALANVPGLRVTARTSAFSFRGKDLDIRGIAGKLNVSTVLEGSVRKAGQRVRVTAQLSNAADGYQIWSDRFDREMTDIFDLQDEISQAIVARLRLKLVGERPAGKRQTASIEAYSAYLKGRYHRYRFTRADLMKSKEYFQQAIALESDYALAHAGMGDFYWTIGGLGLLAPREAMPQARAAAERALALDDSLAEAHALLALVYAVYDYHWDEAAREFRRVLDLDPAGPLGRFRHAMFYLRPMRRMDEAIADMRLALDNDPLSLLYQVNLGNLLYFARRYREAVEQFGRTLEMDPNYYVAHAMLGAAQVQQGRMVEAIESASRAQSLAGENPLVAGGLAAFLGVAGGREPARVILSRMEAAAAGAYVPATSIACVHAGLGDLDQTYAWLDRAVAERDPIVLTVPTDPFYDRIRADARYAPLLRKMGLT